MKTKRILGVLLSLIMIISMLPTFITAFAASNLSITIDTDESVILYDTDGDGYYEIGTADELYAFAAAVNGGQTSINGKLTANIIVNENVLNTDGALNGDGSNFRDWTPIDNSGMYIGTFDGDNKTISGLYFSDTNSYTAGLFGYVGWDEYADVCGTVKNVGVVNSYFSGKENVGGVVGTNMGTVEDCFSSASVSGENYVGGVVGSSIYSEVTVRNCYNTGSVSGTGNYVGGVVGQNNGTVENCYNTGTVSGNNGTGGVTGINNSGDVVNCYNTGTVSGSGCYAGGVVGYNSGTVTNCYYLTGCAMDGQAIQNGIGAANQGSTTEDVEDGTVTTGYNDFSTGEVCYKLNGDQSNIVFKQTIDTDSTPNFTGQPVLLVDGNYTNHVHAWESGFCSCGENESAKQVSDSYYANLNETHSGYYAIENAGQLMWFANFVNSGNASANAVLTTDIDMETVVWAAMGKSSAEAYIGTFDGKGHTISNLSRNTGTNEGARASFAYYLGTGGHIKDVIFDKADVFTQGHANANASAVVALRNSGTISGCIVSNSSVQLGNYAYLAGIAGVNETGGVIENCAVINTSLTRRFGHAHPRAAITHTNNGTVQNCFAYGCTYNNNNTANGGIISAGNAPVNCYYYTTATVSDVYATSKTTEQFANGEVAYLLGEPFGQNIGTDTTPVLGGTKVYNFGIICYNEITKPVIAVNSENVTALLPEETSGTLIVASYNADTNQLIDCKYIAITENTTKALGTDGMGLTFEAGNTIKAFIWSDMTDLVPLCEGKEITITATEE